MAGPEWVAGQRVGWTERDGPSAPPTVPGGSWAASAACIGLATAVLLATDALCPEHRTWVQVLGALAILSAVTSVLGVIKGWVAVPYLVLVSSALGVGIGLIDTAHEPVRGSVVVACFVAAMLLGTWMASRELAALRWARRLRSELESQSGLERSLESNAAPAPPPLPAPAEADPVEPVGREHARRP